MIKFCESSPYKHVMKYDRKGKLVSRLVEPFEILEEPSIQDMKKKVLITL